MSNRCSSGLSRILLSTVKRHHGSYGIFGNWKSGSISGAIEFLSSSNSGETIAKPDVYVSVLHGRTKAFSFNERRESLFSTEAHLDVMEVKDTILNDPGTSRDAYTAQFVKLCKDGDLLSISELLDGLHDKCIFLGSNTCILILAAASKKGDIDLSCRIFNHLVVSHESLSSASYLDLGRSFLGTSDSTKLLKFIKKLVELTSPRSTIIMNRIILSFSESRQIDKALFILNNMNDIGCQPDLVTYNTVLDMLGHVRRVDEVLYQFAAMKEAGIAPDIVSYNTLLNSLRKVGRFDMCEVIMNEMEANGLEPDLLTYTAVIEAFGRSGNVEKSVRLFSEMKLRQIVPSLYIYRSLISNLRKMGKRELVETLTEEMESSLSELAGPQDFKPKKHR